MIETTLKQVVNNQVPPVGVIVIYSDQAKRRAIGVLHSKVLLARSVIAHITVPFSRFNAGKSELGRELLKHGEQIWCLPVTHFSLREVLVITNSPDLSLYEASAVLKQMLKKQGHPVCN